MGAGGKAEDDTGARFDGKRLTWSLEDLILVLGPLVSLGTQRKSLWASHLLIRKITG